MSNAEGSSGQLNVEEPRLALAMVVRDEQRFLGANLAYHHALGVEKAYVYLDRCADASPEIAASYPWVDPIPTTRRDDEPYMSDFQTRCLADALERARREGYQWLLHLDPDEFAWGENRDDDGRFPEDPIIRGSLTRMLRDMAPSTEMVRLRTREVVPVPMPPGTPFWKLHDVLDRGTIRRQILDPTDGRVRTLRYWLGSQWGKSVVRVDADVRPQNAHRWTRAGASNDTPIPTVQSGWHEHFIVVDAPQWRAKYSKFAEYPDRWRSGRPVRFPKQAWKEACRRMGLNESDAYYRKWVAMNPRRLWWARLRGYVVTCRNVEAILERIDLPAQESAS